MNGMGFAPGISMDLTETVEWLEYVQASETGIENSGLRRTGNLGEFMYDALRMGPGDSGRFEVDEFGGVPVVQVSYEPEEPKDRREGFQDVDEAYFAAAPVAPGSGEAVEESMKQMMGRRYKEIDWGP
ncbi:MAG: hypothetical protein ACLFTA_00325 [Candidatus Nanohaloarchaea archaeon]